MSDDMPVYVISVAAQPVRHCTRRRYAVTREWGLSRRGAAPAAGRRYSMRDISRCARSSGCHKKRASTFNGIKRILDLERELEQARLLAAQLHSEVGQVRAELESTRAVAARLAQLRRAPADPAATLVPVRTTTASITLWHAPAQDAEPAQERKVNSKRNQGMTGHG